MTSPTYCRTTGLLVGACTCIRCMPTKPTNSEVTYD